MNDSLIILILALIFLYMIPRYPEPTLIENFITEQERRHIIQEASGKLNRQPSQRIRRLTRAFVRVIQHGWVEMIKLWIP